MKAGQHSLGERARQPVGWVVLAAGAASIALSHSAWSLHHAVHEAIEEAGALLIGACIVGRVFCTLYIGGRKNAQLVRHGPYSVTRNPLYVSSLAGATGVGLSSASLVVGGLFGFAVWLLLSAAIRGEERRLLERFGPEYAAYQREVPRWIPNPSLWRDAPALAIEPRLVGRRLVEGLALLATVPVVEILEQLHEAGALPFYVALP